MSRYTNAVLTIIAICVTAYPSHALDLETKDLNSTWSLIQFGIRADETPGQTYIRGIYANEEECYSDLLEVEYLSRFEKDNVSGRLFGIQESMHGISMVVCTMNMGVVIKK